MTAILNRLRSVAKALVAAAATGLTIAINDVTAELSVQSTGVIATVAAALLVYLVPNKSE